MTMRRDNPLRGPELQWDRWTREDQEDSVFVIRDVWLHCGATLCDCDKQCCFEPTEAEPHHGNCLMLRVKAWMDRRKERIDVAVAQREAREREASE